MPILSKFSKINTNTLGPVQFFFRIVLLVFLAIILGVGLYLFNSIYILHETLTGIGDYSVNVVVSGSMSPEINVNDLIISKKDTSYDIDDVVIYVDNNGKVPVAHRIVNFDNDKVITKGDANNICDSPILCSQIRGKVIGVIPAIGKIFNVSTFYIFGFVVLLLLLISLLFEFKNRKATKARELELRHEIEKLQKNQD